MDSYVQGASKKEKQISKYQKEQMYRIKDKTQSKGERLSQNHMVYETQLKQDQQEVEMKHDERIQNQLKNIQ